MPRFNCPPEQQADIHFVYGLCNGNAAEAAREYGLWYPDRRTLQPHTFINLHRRFGELGLRRTPHERVIYLSVEDEIGLMNS